VVDPENRRSIASAGFVVWLQAAPGVLADRVEADGTERPLLTPRGATATLERLSIVRAAAYEAVADASVETEGRDVSAVADAVLEEFRPADGGGS
jgi:shikimate kinase